MSIVPIEILLSNILKSFDINFFWCLNVVYGSKPEFMIQFYNLKGFLKMFLLISTIIERKTF